MNNSHPLLTASFSSPAQSHLLTLKRRLAIRLGPLLPAPLLQRALQEASDLAVATGFPELFFPVLAEEKVRLVSQALAANPRLLQAA